MKGKTIKQPTAVMIGTGLFISGLMAGSVGTVLLPRVMDRENVASDSDTTQRPKPSEAPSPSPTETTVPEPAASLPTSERRSETVDFMTHTITCSGDVYWDWQVGARARGGDGSCRDWAVAMELDKDGPTPEQQELLDQMPEYTDPEPYYETSGEAQWDHLVQQGVIDADGNYLDTDGYPTGETTYDDEG